MNAQLQIHANCAQVEESIPYRETKSDMACVSSKPEGAFAFLLSPFLDMICSIFLNVFEYQSLIDRRSLVNLYGRDKGKIEN